MDNYSNNESSGELFHVKDITLAKFTLSVKGLSVDSLESFLKMFADETYRIKGFATIDGRNYLVSCVGPIVEVVEWKGEMKNPGQLVVLYGNGLHAKTAAKEAMGWFENADIDFVK